MNFDMGLHRCAWTKGINANPYCQVHKGVYGPLIRVMRLSDHILEFVLQ